MAGLVAAVLYHAINGTKILLIDFFPSLTRHIRGLGRATLVVFGAHGTAWSRPLGRVLAFVRERHSAYAYPREIEFVDDLPKTLTGKIRRIELREQELRSKGKQKAAAAPSES